VNGRHGEIVYTLLVLGGRSCAWRIAAEPSKALINAAGFALTIFEILPLDAKTVGLNAAGVFLCAEGDG
jgi:hypothetical protein